MFERNEGMNEKLYTYTDPETGEKIEAIIKEAQPIVRCKDCKHKCIKGKTTRYHYCEIWKSAVDETDFCSRGEKKDATD